MKSSISEEVRLELIMQNFLPFGELPNGNHVLLMLFKLSSNSIRVGAHFSHRSALALFFPNAVYSPMELGLVYSISTCSPGHGLFHFSRGVGLLFSNHRPQVSPLTDKFISADDMLV